MTRWGNLIVVQHLAFALAYDALDRVTQSQVNDGPAWFLTYHAQGIHQEVKAGSDEGRPGLSWTLDPWGREEERRDGDGTIRTTYNAFGQVVRIVQCTLEGLEQVRAFDYDTVGNLVRSTEPETGTTTMAEFNALGQPRKVTDASGRTVLRAHDALGRVVSERSGDLEVVNAHRGPFLVARRSSDGTCQTFRHGTEG